MNSEVLREHALKPRNVGMIEDADAVGQAGEAQKGNLVVIHLTVENDTIAEAMFQTFGCPTTIGSSSIVTEMVTGMKVERARCATEKDIVQFAGKFPEDKIGCARVVIAALQNALAKLETVSG